MASKNLAIEVRHLKKSFRLPLEQASGLKQMIVNLTRHKKGYKTQHVLDGISFEVKKGEFFGIVGRNGSGKSTLLKLLAGIYSPDSGTLNVNGSLTPFIELGVGFNPELTGRENIFLNGALLGFSRREVEQMYDEIVDFAELEQFMDQKLKNYSSGMQVRLAFSIAIKAESDILLLDEILAVGDESFQRKCFSYFNTLKRNKKTVILVTHDMSAVERFCDRALLLSKGEIELIGKPHIAAAAYSRQNEGDSGAVNVATTNLPFDINLYDEHMNETRNFNYNQTMNVQIKWQQPDVEHVGVAIFSEAGEFIYGPNTFQDGKKLGADHSVTYTVALNLNEGNYFIKAGLFGNTDTEKIAFIEEGPHFTVFRDYDGPRWGGYTQLKHSWK